MESSVVRSFWKTDQFKQVIFPIRPTEGSKQQKMLVELINRNGVIFDQDDARLYATLVSRRKLLQLGWKVWIH